MMKIAMIGAGNIAQRHLMTLKPLPDVEIVGHVSPNGTRAQAAAQQWGGRAYADLNTLLANETVDAAWVTVPPNAHGQIERQLLDSGIPFMVEKPLSADRQTAVDLAAEIETKNLIVAVAYNWRAMDTIPAVQQKLKENPVRMVIGRWYGGTPATPWWSQQAASGGQVIEQATHLLDLARYLVGEGAVISGIGARHMRPQWPNADIADATAALIQFEQAIGVFSTTCLLENSSDVRLQLICDGCTITITLSQVTFDYGHEKMEYKTRANAYQTENIAFIRAVQQQDISQVYCTYADALQTHHLSHDIATLTTPND